jgi:hypothetical protein
VRKSRKQYRALLYDAITQRNNMIEAAEVRADEAKQRDLQLWALGKHREVDFFLFFLFALQMIVMLLLIIFTDFAFDSPTVNRAARGAAQAPYSFYIDSALALFGGFGFLLTYIKRYSFSGLAFAFLIMAFSMQWVIFWLGIWQEVASTNPVWQKTELSITHLQAALYGATAVAISCGSVLGRLDPLQLAIMAVIETFFYALNIYIAYALSDGFRGTPPWFGDVFAETFGRLDPGGSMLVHMFGCWFGLAVGIMLRPRARDPADTEGERDEKAEYHSHTFASLAPCCSSRCCRRSTPPSCCPSRRSASRSTRCSRSAAASSARSSSRTARRRPAIASARSRSTTPRSPAASASPRPPPTSTRRSAR